MVWGAWPQHKLYHSFLTNDLFYCLCLQMKVYNDLGKGVLKNAWEGFNTSLFAYGQTGSGKSWSIVGYGANKGNLFL